MAERKLQKVSQKRSDSPLARGLAVRYCRWSSSYASRWASSRGVTWRVAQEKVRSGESFLLLLAGGLALPSALAF